MADDKKTRGEQRFGGLTYSQIAEWTGLKLSTVQAYGARKVFQPRNLVSVLQWVNARRASRGLPLIGAPDNQAVSPEPTAPIPPSGGYNPETGEYV